MASGRYGPGLVETVANVDELLLARQERVDHVGIEVAAAFFNNHRPGHVVSESVFVNPLGCKSIVYIGDGDNSAAQRNALAFEPGGIAGAVNPLMMRGGDVAGHLQEARL